MRGLGSGGGCRGLPRSAARRGLDFAYRGPHLSAGGRARRPPATRPLRLVLPGKHLQRRRNDEQDHQHNPDQFLYA